MFRGERKVKARSRKPTPVSPLSNPKRIYTVTRISDPRAWPPVSHAARLRLLYTTPPPFSLIVHSVPVVVKFSHFVLWLLEDRSPVDWPAGCRCRESLAGDGAVCVVSFLGRFLQGKTEVVRLGLAQLLARPLPRESTLLRVGVAPCHFLYGGAYYS